MRCSLDRGLLLHFSPLHLGFLVSDMGFCDSFGLCTRLPTACRFIFEAPFSHFLSSIILTNLDLFGTTRMNNGKSRDEERTYVRYIMQSRKGRGGLCEVNNMISGEGCNVATGTAEMRQEATWGKGRCL